MHKVWGNFMAFMQNLNYCMQQKGYSAYRLAKIIGASNQGVLLWQAGKNTPHLKTRQKIADHFGITLAELDGDELPVLPEKGAKKTPTDKIDERVLDAALVSRLCQLTQDELLRVDDFVQGILASRKA